MSLTRDFPDLPPIWAAGTLGAQALAAWLLPIYRLNENAEKIGWYALAAGLAIIGWAAFYFWRKRTSIEPRDTPKALIVEGPFRLNRNPIYSGMAICLFGTGLLLGSISAVALTLAFPFIIERRFIAEEEATLRATFGDEAEAYINRTRRW